MRGLARRSLPPLALGAPVAALSIAMAAIALPTGRAVGMAIGVVVAHAALAGRQPLGGPGSTADEDAAEQQATTTRHGASATGDDAGTDEPLLPAEAEQEPVSVPDHVDAGMPVTSARHGPASAAANSSAAQPLAPAVRDPADGLAAPDHGFGSRATRPGPAPVRRPLIGPDALVPLSSFGVGCLGFAVQALVSGLFLTLPSVLVFPVALYSVTVWGGRVGPWVAGGASLLGSAAATWRLVTDASVEAARLRPSPALVFALLAAIALASLSLGLYRRAQLANVALLEERARRAEAERVEQARRAVRDERQRIAREMHDVVSHSLAVIVSQAKGGRFHAADSPTAERALAVIEDTGRQALTDMRGLLGVLRPETDADRQPQPGMAQLPRLLRRAREAGVSLTESTRGAPRPLSPAAGTAVYRLVQEAVTNIVRHGGRDTGATVVVDWRRTELLVTIRNDTRAVEAAPGSGHGLIGMRERATAVGGRLDAGPDADGGFTVTARIPYPEAT